MGAVGRLDEDEVVRRWEAGETMQAIADRAGVTRQRVGQIFKRRGLDARGKRMAMSAARAREAAERRRYERVLKAMAEATRCPVCDGWAIRPRRGGSSIRTCSAECARAWAAGARWQTFAGHHAHRQEQARAILRRPEKYAGSRVKWAERMLSDNPPPPNRRFRLQGTKVEAAVERARRG